MSSIAAPTAKRFPSLRAHASGALLTATALLAATIAGVLLVRQMNADKAQGVPARASSEVAAIANTSFGRVIVQRVNVVSPSQRLLRAPERIRASSVELRVSVVVGNRLARAVSFSSGQFRLDVPAHGTTIAAIGDAVGRHVIEPGRTVETELAFFAPRAASSLSLEFQDAERPVRVALVRLPAGAPAP